MPIQDPFGVTIVLGEAVNVGDDTTLAVTTPSVLADVSALPPEVSCN